MRNKTVFLVSALVAAVVFVAIAACSGSANDARTSRTPTPAAVLRNPTASPNASGEPAFTPSLPFGATPTFIPGATTSPQSGNSGGVGGIPSTGGGVGSGPATGGGPASGGTSGLSVASSFLVDRKIERNATMDITVDDVPATVAKIEASAGAVGGFVSQETITKSAPASEDDESDRHTATVQIRVPAESYGAVISQLRDFAKEINSESSTTTEVTGQYTDLQAQLRNLQATEGQYLTLLGQAFTVNDILTVQDRLTSIQGQVEQVQGQLQLIDNLTALATITINLSPPAVPSPTPSPSPTPAPVVEPETPSDPNWSSEAWSDAWGASKDLLRYMGVAAITAAVVAAWLLAAGLVIAIGWWLFGGGRKPAAPAP